MNILLVSPFQLADRGGVSLAVTMLCREFSKQAHQIDILIPGESTRVEPLDKLGNASVYRTYLRNPYIKRAPLRGLIAFSLFLPFTLYELYRFLKAKRVDIVAIQYPLPWVFYFAVLRRLSSWKLVVTVQGNDVHDLVDRSWGERWLTKCLLSASDWIIGVSESLLRELQRSFPHLQVKSCIVPNGAPFDMIGQARPLNLGLAIPKEYILTVGQLIERKGIDIVIKALQAVRERGPVVNLVVVGEGPEHSRLLQLAQDAGLVENVHFLGSRSHEEVLELCKNCLFFVLASRAEGLPLVIAEAMACGKAVLATKVDGIPEIVKEGYTGLLVERDDVQSLAEAILKLYRDPELCHTLGRYGKEQASREYSWEAIGERYLSLFRELTSRSVSCPSGRDGQPGIVDEIQG